MKFKLTKALLCLFMLLSLASCVNSSFGEESESHFRNIYPSQFLTGDIYILKENEKIDGNVAGIGTTLIIEEGATVLGDISLVAGNLEVSGRVAGNINVVAGTTTINHNAIITGSINQILNQIETDPGAVIGGEINTYVFPTSAQDHLGKRIVTFLDLMKPSVWLLLQAVRIIVLILATFLTVFLFTKPTQAVIYAIKKNPAVAWGAGILTLFFLPISAIVLILTICLSPIGVIVLLVLFICTIWGWAAVAKITGDGLAHWLKLNWSEAAVVLVGALITGLFVSLVSLIPCIGFLFNNLLAAVGLGGILLTRFGTINV